MGSLPAGSYIIQNSNLFILGITPTKQITSTGMNYAVLHSQLFNLAPQPLKNANAYMIAHISTGNVIELAGGNATPGTQVVLANQTGADNQLWVIEPVIGFKDYHTIRNGASNTVIQMIPPSVFTNSYFGDPTQMWKFLDIPTSTQPSPIVVPPPTTVVPNIPGGGGRPALPGLGRPGDVALVSLFATGNICGNPQCCRTFICAVDYNRNVRPLGYRGV